MPNWCGNDLTVTGDVNKIKKFNEEFLKDGYNCCVKIPDELQNTSSPSRIVPDSEYEEIISKASDTALERPFFIAPMTSFMSQELIKKYGADNWYDFSCKFWGCKWNVDTQYLDPVFSDDDREVSYSFDSPWGPPTVWVEHAAKYYGLNFRITFSEGGCDFCGVLEVGPDGEILDNRESNYRSELAVELFGSEYFEDDAEYIIENLLEGKSKKEIFEMLKPLGYKKGDDAEKFLDKLSIDDLLELEFKEER